MRWHRPIPRERDYVRSRHEMKIEGETNLLIPNFGQGTKYRFKSNWLQTQNSENSSSVRFTQRAYHDPEGFLIKLLQITPRCEAYSVSSVCYQKTLPLTRCGLTRRTQLSLLLTELNGIREHHTGAKNYGPGLTPRHVAWISPIFVIPITNTLQSVVNTLIFKRTNLL